VDAEYPRQGRHDASGLAPKEMFVDVHQNFMIGRTSTDPPSSKIGQPLENSTA
jgi:hypothetical protein